VGHKAKERKIHWIKGANLYKQKVLGGMGFREMDALMKRYWLNNFAIYLKMKPPLWLESSKCDIIQIAVFWMRPWVGVLTLLGRVFWELGN